MNNTLDFLKTLLESEKDRWKYHELERIWNNKKYDTYLDGDDLREANYLTRGTFPVESGGMEIFWTVGVKGKELVKNADQREKDARFKYLETIGLIIIIVLGLISASPVVRSWF